ncbi:MAG: Eco57I restriction-modification methylase domain-containing protein [Bacteroidales bacterium]|nr:Eco57I restriction-modification methylase domain-containing protein [Bacteroidales bacterium]
MELHNKGLQPLVVTGSMDDERLAFSKGLQPLVKMMTCTREHAFRPEYKGGFDVVIGNPPYVQLQSMGEMSDILKNCGYETFDKGADLYCIFTERGYKLLKKGGLLSFIMPNKWMLVAYGKPLRKFLSKPVCARSSTSATCNSSRKPLHTSAYSLHRRVNHSIL